MRPVVNEPDRRRLLRTGTGWIAAAVLCKGRDAVAQFPNDLIGSLSRKGLALLIGVSNYRQGWDRLPQTLGEVDALAAGLTQHFTRVFTLKDPSSSDIRSTLRDFLLGRGNVNDERIFVFYAGHGFTDFNQASNRSTGYITGVDTPIYDPNHPQVDQAVAFEEIDALNSQTRARHVLMIFDSCFAGSLFLTRGFSQPQSYDISRLRTLNDQPSRYYITSGDETNQVPANSPMADLILRGLSGEADLDQSGYVTDEDLALYLKRNIPRFTRRPLNPQSGGIADSRLSRGKFIFLTGLNRPPNMAPSVPQAAAPDSNQLAPHPARTYLVFFDWDSAVVTQRALSVIQMAADAFRQSGATKVLVNGYTDSSKSSEYAMALTTREAQSVAAALVAAGVPREAITVRSYGKTNLLVPTNDGVREPQNRRAEIIIAD